MKLPSVSVAHKAIAAVLACAAAMIACTTETEGRSDEPAAAMEEQAITRGVDDEGDESVVALVQDDHVMCSGTLVSERVVLTAAHCVDEAGVLSLPSVFFGATYRPGDVTYATSHARVESGFVRASLTHDLALLVLADAPPVLPHPARVRDANAPMAKGVHIGTEVRIVGFGSTHASRAGPTKRSATTRIATWGEGKFELDPQGPLACHGDSGGPVFAMQGDREVVVGVTSSGDPLCQVQSVATLLDATSLAFIAQAVDATGAASTSIGGVCYFEAQCTTGHCEPALDDPNVRTCVLPCAADPDCVHGTQCASDHQCRPAVPTPTAFGSSCSSPVECASGHCVHGVCETPCWPDGVSCAENQTCESSNAGEGPPFLCRSARSPNAGGCAMSSAFDRSASRPSGDVISVSLALLWTVSALRRARRAPQAPWRKLMSDFARRRSSADFNPHLSDERTLHVQRISSTNHREHTQRTLRRSLQDGSVESEFGMVTRAPEDLRVGVEAHLTRTVSANTPNGAIAIPVEAKNPHV